MYGHAYCYCGVVVWIRGCCGHETASLLARVVLVDHPSGCPPSSDYFAGSHAAVEARWEGMLA